MLQIGRRYLTSSHRAYICHSMKVQNCVLLLRQDVDISLVPLDATVARHQPHHLPCTMIGQSRIGNTLLPTLRGGRLKRTSQRSAWPRISPQRSQVTVSHTSIRKDPNSSTWLCLRVRLHGGADGACGPREPELTSTAPRMDALAWSKHGCSANSVVEIGTRQTDVSADRGAIRLG